MVKELMSDRVVEMTLDNANDYELRDYSFMVIGRLIPEFRDGEWSQKEELYAHPYESKYPENEELDDYIDSEDSIAFLYYSEGKCIGHIRVSSNEEIKFVSIDRLIVLEENRGKGIGTALLNKAKEWAISKGMKGFSLETQDINLLACRFYLKNKFELGAVDTSLYSNSKYKDEKALFFYLKF